MLDIIAITGPIFIVIAIGYLAVRFGIVDGADMPPIGRFTVTIALPALIFQAIATRPMREVLDVPYAASYALGSLLILVLGYMFSRLITGLPKPHAAMRTMGMTCPNSGFIGYPILLIVLPDLAAQVLALNFIVENVLLIPLLLALGERGRDGEELSAGSIALKTVTRLARSPLMIAVALAIPFSLIGIPLPEIVTRPLSLLAAVAVGAALFFVGGTLASLGTEGMDRQVIATTIGKLVVHPLAVAAAYLALTALGMKTLEGPMLLALIVTASIPAFSIYPVLASGFGYGARASFALLVQTACAFATLTALLHAFRHLG